MILKPDCKNKTMNNKTLILGKGYLGKEFERHGFETWGKDSFNINYLDKSISGYQLDDLRKYNVIINCIGKSNTRWCETPENFKEAMAINGYLPKILSEFCNTHNIKFIQLSTGCLYDNTKKPNTEESFMSAHCKYTITKWVGEIGCNPKTDLIIRPRLYFSDIQDRNNLLCKLPNYDAYVGNAVDSFTCTSTIVGAIKELLLIKQCGIFNVAQRGVATIADIAAWCNLPVNEITTIEKVRKKEKLYLVNNVMDISKLLPFYYPMDIETAIKLSYSALLHNKASEKSKQ